MGSNQLTAARLRELLHYSQDTGLFTRRTDNNRGQRVGDVAGCIHARTGYVTIYVDGRNYTAARLAWLYMTNREPSFDMDHINGIKHDNRWCNLRDIPTQHNSQNTHGPNKNNKSGFMGVHFRAERGKWVAQLRINGKATRVGTFATPEAANAAYIEAKRIHHPGFSS